LKVLGGNFSISFWFVNFGEVLISEGGGGGGG